MADWLFNLPVVWMAVVVFATTYAITTAIYGVVMALATGARARACTAVSPGLLPPLGIIFGLLIGSLAAQVWTDSDRANTAVNREASALRDVVLLAANFPGEPESRLRELVHRHIDHAWSANGPPWPRGARP
jgi:hypothetical protein